MNKSGARTMANDPKLLRHLVRKLAARLTAEMRLTKRLKVALEITWTLIVIALAYYAWEVLTRTLNNCC